MTALGHWLAGIIFGVLSTLGLFIAGNAHDVGFSLFGFLLALFGVLMLIRLIELNVSSHEEAR